MKLFRTLFLSFGLFQAASANDDFITGMKGLQQAAKDPKLLAQLMADLNVSFVLGISFCYIM